MESEKHILDPVDLESGLVVHFEDQTTPPVAGRCQVRLLIRVPIMPTAAHFETYPNPSQALDEFASLAGTGPVEFQVEKVRNFIDQKEVPRNLEAMKEEFARTNLEYMKKPAFAGNFIRKKYDELRQNRK